MDSASVSTAVRFVVAFAQCMNLSARNFAEMMAPFVFRKQAGPTEQNLKSARRNEKKTRPNASPRTYQRAGT